LKIGCLMDMTSESDGLGCFIYVIFAGIHV
jgi:hypothetical protein